MSQPTPVQTVAFEVTGASKSYPGSKAAGLAMAFKLIQATERRWRAVNAPT